MGHAGQLYGRVILAVVGLIVAAMTPAALAAREIGVDVSHFQGETGMPAANWNQLATEGRSFAFIKATEGLNPPGNVDAAWPTNLQRATDAGILNGVYHLARPDNRPTVPGAVQEADFFVATAGSAMTPGHLRPVIDVEKIGATQTAADLSAWVNAFVNEVVALKGASAKPILYTTSTFAVTRLDSSVSTLDLWIRANSFGDPQSGNPSPIGLFHNWAFWQYNVGPAGGISSIDQNVVHTEFRPLSAYVIPEPALAGVLLAATITMTSARSRRRCR